MILLVDPKSASHWELAEAWANHPELNVVLIGPELNATRSANAEAASVADLGDAGVILRTAERIDWIRRQPKFAVVSASYLPEAASELRGGWSESTDEVSKATAESYGNITKEVPTYHDGIEDIRIPSGVKSGLAGESGQLQVEVRVTLLGGDDLRVIAEHRCVPSPYRSMPVFPLRRS